MFLKYEGRWDAWNRFPSLVKLAAFLGEFFFKFVIFLNMKEATF